MQITRPDYISQNMFDRICQDLFSLKTSGEDLRQQMVILLQLFRGSAFFTETISDIEAVADSARAKSAEKKAEIAYVMGMQLGFELAIAYPPSESND